MSLIPWEEPAFKQSEPCGKTWSSGAIFWDHRDKDLQKRLYLEKLSSFIGIYGFYSQLKCWQHNWAGIWYTSSWFLVAKTLQIFFKNTVTLYNIGKLDHFWQVDRILRRKKYTSVTSSLVVKNNLFNIIS